VSQVARGSPSRSQAGNTDRRWTLFGEMDGPGASRTRTSGLVVRTRVFQSPTSRHADADSGICRALASVFGVLNVPSQTASRTLSTRAVSPMSFQRRAEQLAASKTREDCETDERSRQRRQRRYERRRLLGPERTLGADTPERGQVNALRRVLHQVSPLHGGPQDGTQHIVDVIDGLGCVADAREMGDIGLIFVWSPPRPAGRRNCGSRCLSSMKRRCYWVECLYIGRTGFDHSVASVANVTRDRFAAPSAAAVTR
jgi:hypothetical protein